MTCFLDINEMDNNKLPILAGDLYVASCDDPSNLINFGWVKTLNSVLDNDADRIEVKPNNRAPISWASIVPQINIEFLESVDVEKIALLYWLTVNVVAWIPVIWETEDWNDKKRLDLIWYPLANRESDWSAASITSITGSVDGALVENDDFTVTINSIGETVITFDVTGWTLLTTMFQDFIIVYDYTPVVSSNLELIRKFKADKKFRVVIVTEPNENGKFNVIELKWAIFKWQYSIDIADLTVAWDIVGTTWLFEWLRGSKIKYEIQTITS